MGFSRQEYWSGVPLPSPCFSSWGCKVLDMTERLNGTELNWATFTSTSTGGSNGRESACNAGDLGSNPKLGRSPGERNGCPVFLPGNFHGQRSLVDYSLWGYKESDGTEWLTHTLIYRAYFQIHLFWGLERQHLNLVGRRGRVRFITLINNNNKIIVHFCWEKQ